MVRSGAAAVEFVVGLLDVVVVVERGLSWALGREKVVRGGRRE